MLRERSDQTAAIFIYLPKPPRIDSPNWSETSLQYLELLTELTADLPPTVMINKFCYFWSFKKKNKFLILRYLSMAWVLLYQQIFKKSYSRNYHVGGTGSAVEIGVPFTSILQIW